MSSSYQEARKVKKYIQNLIIEADVGYMKFEEINTESDTDIPKEAYNSQRQGILLQAKTISRFINALGFKSQSSLRPVILMIQNSPSSFERNY